MIEHAKAKALERVELALGRVKEPAMLMQFFSQGENTLDFSSHLIHRWPTDDRGTFRLEWASTYVAEKVVDLLSQDACTQMLTRLIADPRGSASGIIFETYVLRVFREGGRIFEIKDLETGELSRLEIPRNPETMHFNTITQAMAGTLWIPNICNYACVDLLIALRDLFQITVSDSHPVKGPSLIKLLDSLTQARRMSFDEPRLIFVVPSRVHSDFEKQNYLTSEKKVYHTVPDSLLRVKQYVLEIDLESAAAGRSSGIQVEV